MNHYTKHFEGKTVLCNCDDPFESNFCKFFLLNFNYLKLKRLICTSYSGSKILGTNKQMSLFDEDDNPVVNEHGYVLDVTHVPHAADRDITEDDISALLNKKRGGVKKLKGNGSFDSEECIEYLKQADIVVTNCPWSRFRDYMALLEEYHKKYLILGNKNAITYKEIFPLLKDNKMWLGYCSPSEFKTPDAGVTKKVAGLGRWFTNLDIKKRHEDLILWKHYYDKNGNPTGEFQHYDNYAAINVDKVSEIPIDYEGVMGVPITFLDKYNPEQFEIVSFRKGEDGKDLVFTREREREFNRTFVSLYDSEIWFDNRCKADDMQRWEESLRKSGDSKEIEPVDMFYPLSLTNRAAGTMNGLISQ